MKTAWIIDGAYLAGDSDPTQALTVTAHICDAVQQQCADTASKAIYFDACVDVDAAFAGPLVTALRTSEVAGLRFETHLTQIADCADNAKSSAEARQLVIAEMTVCAIDLVVFDSVERLVLVAGDAALEPAIAMIRRHGLRELWHVARRCAFSPALRAHADRTVWIDELV